MNIALARLFVSSCLLVYGTTILQAVEPPEPTIMHVLTCVALMNVARVHVPQPVAVLWGTTAQQLLTVIHSELNVRESALLSHIQHTLESDMSTQSSTDATSQIRVVSQARMCWGYFVDTVSTKV